MTFYTIIEQMHCNLAAIHFHWIGYWFDSIFQSKIEISNNFSNTRTVLIFRETRANLDARFLVENRLTLVRIYKTRTNEGVLWNFSCNCHAFAFCNYVLLDIHCVLMIWSNVGHNELGTQCSITQCTTVLQPAWLMLDISSAKSNFYWSKFYRVI